MELNALRHFYWVVCEGNFSKASQRLKVAQPSVSRMVKKLEESVGTSLLHRHKRHVELTETGNLVFRHCKTIFENISDLENIGRRTMPQAGGPLGIATCDPIAQSLFPEILESLYTEFPRLLPSVQVAPAHLLIPQIRSGKIELGIFFYIPPEFEEGILLESAFPVRFRFVKAKGSKPNLQAFIGSREIESPNTRDYPTLDKLRKLYPDAHIQFSSNHIGLHRELVLRGLGVAILPEFLIRKELKAKKLTDVLPGEKYLFDLKIVRHAHRPLSTGAQAFLSHLHQTAPLWS